MTSSRRTTLPPGPVQALDREAGAALTTRGARGSDPSTSTGASLLPLAAVHVVIPAHDEETLVGACLDSVAHAAAVLAEAHPDLTCRTTVVLDRCRDDTASIARGRGVDTLAVDAGCVGAARSAGVRRAHDLSRHLDPERVLVVNTDADCVVPPSWLVDHVRHASAHHLVQGDVRPDPSDMSVAALAEWVVRNPPGRGSLHGANLGFRLAAYLAAGGFPEVAQHEDVLLVGAMKRAGARATVGTSVLTSGRRHGRVEGGGFAGYLRDLDRELQGARETSTDLPHR